MISQGIQTYLEEVLGVRNLISPATVPSAHTPVNSYYQEGEQPRLLLWVSHSPDQEETTLIQKMMSAAKINSYLVFWGSELGEIPSAYFASGLETVMQFFDEEPRNQNAGSLKFVVTSPLSSMLKGTSREIQQHKKKVWNQLQALVKEQHLLGAES